MTMTVLKTTPTTTTIRKRDSPSAWAGIAIAGAAGLTTILYLLITLKEEESKVLELDETGGVL